MKQIANILSVVLYPLFVPTYGVALFCYAFSTQLLPLHIAWILVALIGTLLLTCVLPITSIWLLMRQGRVSSMQIENASERTMPYLYATIGFGFWSYLMIAILHAPVYIGFIAVGATVAILIVSLINRRWKISAHLTGFGGLFGGLMAYYYAYSMMPGWGTLGIWLGLTLVLMYARLYLKAHTPTQVVAGWLLGFSSTFIPYLIYSYGA